MPYYCEEIGFHGRPMRRVYKDKPSDRTADGGRRKFHVAPVEINPGEVFRTLDQLAKDLAKDGKFRSERRAGK